MSITPETQERRTENKSAGFPIKRRKSDDIEISQCDPYIRLNLALDSFAITKAFSIVVLSTDLKYLVKRVQTRLPNAKIVFADDDVMNLSQNILCIVNLCCRRKHETYTNLNFREILERGPGDKEPLYTLNFVSKCLTENDSVTFLSLGEFVNQSIVKRLLLTTKFKEVEFVSSHLVYAKKRALLKTHLPHRPLRIEEIQSRREIDLAQEFLKSQFSSRECIYDERIDNLFTNHSDFFWARENNSRTILGVARHTWHLPNHMLPLMFANKKNSEHHVQLQTPNKILYGEIMVVSEPTKLGKIISHELIWAAFRHLGQAGLDVLFTTFRADAPEEGTFYKKRYGFIPTGITLEYGDFGGDWALIYGPWDLVHKAFTGEDLGRKCLG